MNHLMELAGLDRQCHPEIKIYAIILKICKPNKTRESPNLCD